MLKHLVGGNKQELCLTDKEGFIVEAEIVAKATQTLVIAAQKADTRIWHA